MPASLRPFTLGWHPIDPGPGPRSPLLDRPPAPTGADYATAYLQWRADVETDEAQLLRTHLSGPVWAPVPLPPGAHVLPVYGGTPGAIEQLVATLVTSSLESGGKTCRIVNLSGWDLSAELRDQMRTARQNKAQFDEVSARGSTVNLFGNPDPSELVALLADALRVSAERTSGRQSQQERQELERVIAMLRAPITLDRIIDAVDLALGAGRPSASLSIDEVRDLQDYFATVVGQRRATQDRLSDLHVDLRGLRGFGKAAGRAPATFGNGRTTIRWYDVTSGNSTVEVELGRELIARAVLQTFTKPGAEELLVVVGAERLSDDVADEMVNAALRNRKRVALVYTRTNDAARRMLGVAGSSLALFLRMPNPADAAVAAEFLGREYKFLLNGISIAEGQTEDWNRSYGTSTSHSTSLGRSHTGTLGFQGGAFSYSRSVGSSITRSFEQGSSMTSTTGGSSSTTATRSAGRVHEYVVEPEAFQQMPEDTMMIVGRGTVSIVSCENRLRWSKQTSTQLLAVP